jgi:hypothetical protein
MTMNIPINENEIKTFIYDWFSKLDNHPDVAQMLPLLSETLAMKMPEDDFQNHEGFVKWYRGVNKFRDQSHTPKALDINIGEDSATIKLINHWQRTDSESQKQDEVLGFYAAQTWVLERRRQTQNLVIRNYTVDYFLPILPENKKQLAQETLLELRPRKMVLDEKVEGWLGAAGGFFSASSFISAFSDHHILAILIGLVLLFAGWLRIMYFRSKILWIEDASLNLNKILNDKAVDVKEWDLIFEQKDGCARTNLKKALLACPYTALIMCSLLSAQFIMLIHVMR